jgi:uncharacterized caspase-like protein
MALSELVKPGRFLFAVVAPPRGRCRIRERHVRLIARGALVLTLMVTCTRREAPREERAAYLEASASERRIALVVGSNAGSPARPRLRYAEQDAEKIARVLAELGGFERGDVHLQKGLGLGDLRRGLRLVAEDVKASKAHHPSSRALLVFYFSGHSDGLALELGGERLPYDELRQTLRDTGAEIRLAILDACQSGAVIGTKGGKLAAAFDLTAVGLPALSGEAFLSASRANEQALESSEIQGAFFTHHLVSGLRGAADADRNSLVTLEELYRYTANRTSTAAASTTFGAQTPAYDYRLVGHGDLVLANLRPTTDTIYLPGGFDRVLIIDQASGRVEAEVGHATSVRVAVPAGDYLVRGESGGVWYRRQAKVVAGLGWNGRVVDFARETPIPAPDQRPLAEVARDFRPGNSFPTPMPRTNPYFCEPTDGNWRACRNGGCWVCQDMVDGFPFYFRNHPNCAPNSLCKGMYFPCSANCPPPSAADSCDALPDGWLGCRAPCELCSEEIFKYPRYFENHPNCVSMPGRCKDKLSRCGAACPAPTEADR